MLSEYSRSSDDSPASEPEGCAGTHGLSGGERRWDNSSATSGGSPTTEDGAVMEKALHNTSQVQAHIG